MTKQDRVMVKVDFRIERETEKAVLAEVKVGECINTTKYKWLPKSAIRVETFVQTVNQATNEPQTYGKRVVEITEWLAKQINW